MLGLAAAQAPTRMPKRGTPASAVDGAHPEAIALPRGGFRILLDGDGDQRKDLDLRLKVAETWPDTHEPGAAKTLNVHVIQRSTGQTLTATFQLPRREQGGLLAPTLRETVTDGQRSTRISLLKDPRAEVLEILPGVHTPKNTLYALRVGGQNSDLRFRRDPRRAKRIGRVTAATSDGGIHLLSVTLGAYRDRFRLSFRQTGDTTATFGIRPLDEPTSGDVRGAELTMLRGPIAPKVVPSAPTGLAIDLDGDGRPDLFIHDRLTTAPHGFDGAGPPTTARGHEIRVTGPALAADVTFAFRLRRQKLVDHGGVRRPADDEARRDHEARDELPRQRRLGGPPDALRAVDGATIAHYRGQTPDGVISAELVDAVEHLWLTLGQLPRDPSLLDRALHEVETYAKAFQQITHQPGAHPPYAHRPGAVPVPARGVRNALHARQPDVALRAFSGVIREMDALIETRGSRMRGRAVDRNDADRDRTPSAQTLQRLRTELAAIPKNATRVAAQYHPNPNAFGGEQGYMPSYPLQMFVWNDGVHWHLRNVANPNDASTFSVEAKPNQAVAPPELFATLNNSDYFPQGAISYQVPGGSIQRIVIDAGVSWKVFMGRAAVTLLVAGVALTGVGALAEAPMLTTVATVLIDAASVAATARAVLDLTQRRAHKNLDTETIVIDTLALAGGIFHNLGTASRILVGATPKGSLAAVAHLANRYYIPLSRQAGAAIDGTALLAMTPLAVERLKELESAPMPEGKKQAARLELLASLIATGAANLIRHKAGAAVPGYATAYRRDLFLSRGADGRYVLGPAPSTSP